MNNGVLDSYHSLILKFINKKFERNIADHKADEVSNEFHI